MSNRGRSWAVRLAVAALFSAGGAALAQRPFQPIVQQGNDRDFPPQRGAGVPGASERSLNSAGGGAQADFESLMQLIQSTIAPDTWDEVGGRGSIQPFPTGVYVDAEGVLRKARPQALLTREAARRLVAAPADAIGAAARDPRVASPLRKVSLRRLEQAVAERLAEGRGPADEQLVLAGMRHVRYVLLDAENDDVILAGPADDWSLDAQGRVVSAADGAPVVRLDDLVALLRRYGQDAAAPLGCAITPRPERLASLQEFLAATSTRPLKRGQRDVWLEAIRRRVGRQDVEFFGIDPTSRVAQVLIEADYHMKRVGIGLEAAPASMRSYLASLDVAPGKAPPPLDVLRWWFALDEGALAVGEDGRSYELPGDGVRVLSENELLAAQGQRVHTGASEPLNAAFAAEFTAHFDELARMYPIYGELRNVFQLALCAALAVRAQRESELVWDFGCFAPGGAYRVPRSAAPKSTESVANLKVVRRTTVLAIVSGGVSLAPREILEQAPSLPRASVVPLRRPASGAWWWDEPSE